MSRLKPGTASRRTKNNRKLEKAAQLRCPGCKTRTVAWVDPKDGKSKQRCPNCGRAYSTGSM